MSAGPGRRSMRTQTKRPRYPGEHDGHYVSEFSQTHYHDGSGMNPGNWHHHVQDNYLGYQYQHHGHGHSSSYQSHQYGHGHIHGHGHGHHQQYHHHHMVDDHGGPSDHPIPGTSRSLRARSSGGHVHGHSHGHSSSSIPVGRNRKGGSGPVASTSASADGPQVIESDEDDGDDPDKEAGTSSKSKNAPKMETVLTVDQMMYNSLFYLLLMQHKKIPVKRSDMIKTAMNSQHKQFSEVMKKLEHVLTDVFGMNLVCLGKGKDNQPYIISGPADAAIAEEEEEEQAAPGKGKGKVKGPTGTSTSYMLVSKFPSSVFDSSMFVMARRDPEADSKKTALYLILATIFMLNRPIDEEVIWKIILEMGFSPMVCGKREDLRKFLKSEYVLPCYLNMETIELPNPNLAKHSSKEAAPAKPTTERPGGELIEYTKAKYSWGPRSDKEYSKYAMLKFVTARYPGRKMYEFTVQYNLVQRQEKDMIDKDIYEERDPEPTKSATAAAAGKNGSAIKIKPKAGGKGETFSIDGENTETETEAGE